MFDVAHGAGLAAVWGSWARYVYRENPARFARFARNVLGVDGAGGEEETALAGIAAMEAFYRSIHMPVSLPELGLSLTEAQIETLSEKCSFGQTRTIGTVKKLDKADIAAIYRACSFS